MTTTPSRLKDAELARLLIATGHHVGAPPRGAMQRTLNRLEGAAAAGLFASGAGLGAAKAATHGVTLVGGATSSAGTATTGLGGLSAVKALASSLIAKCFASGLAVGLVAGGGAVGATIGGQALWRATQATTVAPEGPKASRPLPKGRTELTHAVKTDNGSEQAAQLEPARPAEHLDRAVAVPEATSRTVKSLPDPPNGNPLSPELARELSLLDRARSALERGDVQRALHWLDQHRGEFPKGQLVPEAALLRGQAESKRSREPVVRETVHE